MKLESIEIQTISRSMQKHIIGGTGFSGSKATDGGNYTNSSGTYSFSYSKDCEEYRDGNVVGHEWSEQKCTDNCNSPSDGGSDGGVIG